MTKTQRGLVLVLLIAAAIVCYMVGSIVGLGVFLILGLIFELIFWFGLLAKNKKSKQD